MTPSRWRVIIQGSSGSRMKSIINLLNKPMTRSGRISWKFYSSNISYRKVTSLSISTNSKINLLKSRPKGGRPTLRKYSSIYSRPNLITTRNSMTHHIRVNMTNPSTKTSLVSSDPHSLANSLKLRTSLKLHPPTNYTHHKNPLFTTRTHNNTQSTINLYSSLLTLLVIADSTETIPKSLSMHR